MPGAGIGTGFFGSMSFGTGATSAIALLTATPITLNEVLVTYSGSIGVANACDPNDPINRTAWTLTPLNPGICTRLVQFVTHDGERFLVTFDGPLCCGEPYRLTNSLAMATMDSVVFESLCVAPSAKSRDVRFDDGFLRDIANPFLVRDAVMQGQFVALGTYEITDDGDIAQDGGERSLRKRILRRIITVGGEFFHLPNYGSDLEIKRLLKPDLLLRIQTKLEAQILREPEVSAVTVRCRRAVSGESGIVSVFVSASTSGGSVVEVSSNLP